MRKLALIAFAMAVVPAALAQNTVSSFSGSGTAYASTTSTRYVYTRGGGPRTGFYWYWNPKLVQATQVSTSIPFTGTSAPQFSFGSIFPIQFSKKFPVFPCQGVFSHQVRAKQACLAQRFAPPPFPDQFMVPRKQDIGNSQSPELRGACVLGILQQAVAKRVGFCRFFAAKHPWNEPGNSIHDGHGCDFAA